MAKIGSLNINFETNVAQILNDFQRVSSGVSSASRNISASLDFVKKAAATYISYQVIASGASFIHQQMEMIDANAKLADSLNISTQSVSAMSLVFDEAGVGGDNLSKIMTSMSNAIASAAQGSKSQADAFKAIGISVNDLMSMSPDQQFARIAEALDGVDNTTLRVAYSSDIFGSKLGRELLPMLGSYKESVLEAAAFNEKFGISLDRLDSAKVEQANDAFGRVTKILGGLANTASVELSPAITAISEHIASVSYESNNLSHVTASAMDLVAEGGDVMRRAWHGLRLVLQGDLIILHELKSAAFSFLNYVGEAHARVQNLLPGVEGRTAAISKDDVLAAQEDARKAWINMDKIIADGKKTFVPGNNLTDKLNAARLKAQREAENTAIARYKDMKTGARSISEELDSISKKTINVGDAAAKASRKYADGFKRAGIEIEGTKNNLSEVHAALSNMMKDGLGSLFSGNKFLSGISGDLTNLFLPFLNGIFGSLPSFDVGTPYVPRDMVAQIHKGERILTADENKNYGSGGGQINVFINNNTSSRASVSQKQNGTGGRDLMIQLDEVVSNLLSDPGSRSARAAKGIGTLTSR